MQGQRPHDPSTLRLGVTDQEVLGDRPVDEVVVAFRADIRPDEGDQGTGDQEQRIVRDVTPDTVHAYPPALPCPLRIIDRGAAGKGKPRRCGGAAPWLWSGHVRPSSATVLARSRNRHRELPPLRRRLRADGDGTCAAPGLLGAPHGAGADRGASARRTGPCLGPALHRPLGRPAAAVARDERGAVLRPRPGGGPSDGFLLSRL